jgi:hypothetical protein
MGELPTAKKYSGVHTVLAITGRNSTWGRSSQPGTGTSRLSTCRCGARSVAGLGHETRLPDPCLYGPIFARAVSPDPTPASASREESASVRSAETPSEFAAAPAAFLEPNPPRQTR